MTSETSRTLLISRNLPPLRGGMERLNWHLLEELAKACDVDVVAPADSTPPTSGRVRLHGAPGRPLWRFLVAATWLASYLAHRHRPCIVLAGSGLTAPAAWLAARTSGARAAVYLHGLDISVDHPVYRHLWLPVLRRMDVVLVNSTATHALARKAGIADERLHVVHPGVQLPEPHQSDTAMCARLREDAGLGTGPLLLSVGRLTRRKGLVEFARDVLPEVVERHPQARLVIIGGLAEDALNPSLVHPEDILAATPEHVRANIHFLGPVQDDVLALAYRASAVHVFPVQIIAGDPEGFGMVAIEAAAHGLATVAYAAGGVTDAVRHNVSGYLAPAGDPTALTRWILQAIDQPLPSAPMRGFARTFSWQAFGSRIRSVMDEATKDWT